MVRKWTDRKDGGQSSTLYDLSKIPDARDVARHALVACGIKDAQLWPSMSRSDEQDPKTMAFRDLTLLVEFTMAKEAGFFHGHGLSSATTHQYEKTFESVKTALPEAGEEKIYSILDTAIAAGKAAFQESKNPTPTPRGRIN